MDNLDNIKIFVLLFLLSSSSCNANEETETVTLPLRSHWREQPLAYQRDIIMDYPANFYRLYNKNRQGFIPYESKQTEIENDQDYDLSDKESESLPYGQNIRDVQNQNHIRSLSSLKHKAIEREVFQPRFQPLCPSIRETIRLNSTFGYEYRPNHYETITCVHAYINRDNNNQSKNKVCMQGNFSCIQLHKTIFLTRKSITDDCWESETRIIPAGCECMWPKHILGDIDAYN